MKTCKTCRHWKFLTNHPNSWIARPYCQPEDPETGELMAMPFVVRECKHPAITFCERPVEPNGFGVADGSTYRAILVTGEDFGCIRHEQP
jgi:hypothetical protein